MPSDTKLQLDEKLINSVINIAKKAGSEIMKIYNTDFNIHIKDDSSPLTEADIAANNIIMKGLKKISSNISILSEEGITIPYDERSNWDSYWLIDPIDGTKEFIKKNNEFTVNIAYLCNNTPIFGVVYAPALYKLYWGSIEKGSFLSINGSSFKSINVASNIIYPVQIATSRSHPSSKLDSFLSQFTDYNLCPMGSSLKICSVAEGIVHFYPRLGPTMEWDTAAAHAIIKSAGGDLIELDKSRTLRYNKISLKNPNFIAGNSKLIKSLN